MALKKRKRERVRERVDLSRINPNETNPILQAAIRADEVEYLERMASLFELQEVLGSLPALKGGAYLSEKFICNFVLSHWWNLRFSPGDRPIYLPFADIHFLSLEIMAKGFVSYEGLEQSPFLKLYRSTACRKKERLVCFFLLRNQEAVAKGRIDNLKQGNHFFPVLFNYEDRIAHVFGTTSVTEPEIRVERGNGSGWQSWLGPKLWKSIGQGMGWGADVGDPNAVKIVTKNWHQVCGPSSRL